RYGQRVDAVVFGVGPDELHEGHLATEIESNDQAVVSSRNIEPDALAVQYLGFWSGLLDFIGRSPVRCLDERVPAFERDFRLRVLAPEINQCVPGDDPHGAN